MALLLAPSPWPRTQRMAGSRRCATYTLDARDGSIDLASRAGATPLVVPALPTYCCSLAYAAAVRSIWRRSTVENISVRREGNVLFVPAGPAFRLESEIKNVVTAVAKTHHYWQEHVQGASARA
jgi:hypothetical protein